MIIADADLDKDLVRMNSAVNLAPVRLRLTGGFLTGGFRNCKTSDVPSVSARHSDVTALLADFQTKYSTSIAKPLVSKPRARHSLKTVCMNSGLLVSATWYLCVRNHPELLC